MTISTMSPYKATTNVNIYARNAEQIKFFRGTILNLGHPINEDYY
jgi:hypothetical protein